MKTDRQRSSWIALVAAVALGLVASHAAEDKPATAAPSASADALTNARREFDAVKAGRGAAQPQKNDLPRVSIPEMQAPPPPAGSWQPPKSTKPEKKSANWLVEAMEKSAEARSDRDRERTGGGTAMGMNERERDRLRDGRAGDTDVGERGEPGEPRSERRSTDEREPRSATAVSNPLTGYLGTWMTPQDFALLKPGIDQSAANSAEPFGNGASNFSSVAPTLPTLGPDGLLGSSAASARPAAAAPRENPYLAMLNTVPSPAIAAPTAVSPTIGSSAPSMPPSIIAPVVPKPNPKSAVPDFAKPSTDEKYFKQLKRF